MNHEWRSDGDESLAREVTHWLATGPNAIPAIIDQLRRTPSHAQQTSNGDGLPNRGPCPGRSPQFGPQAR